MDCGSGDRFASGGSSGHPPISPRLRGVTGLFPLAGPPLFKFPTGSADELNTGTRGKSTPRNRENPGKSRKSTKIPKIDENPGNRRKSLKIDENPQKSTNFHPGNPDFHPGNPDFTPETRILPPETRILPLKLTISRPETPISRPGIPRFPAQEYPLEYPPGGGGHPPCLYINASK